MNAKYVSAARFLLEVAPVVFRHPLFVLKGGTAINLFVRDMPRLSVDLDLVVADHTKSREDALAAVSIALKSIRDELVDDLGLQCELGAMSQGAEVKLFIERDRIRIKVEVNHVFRGTVLPPENRSLVKAAQDAFFTDIEVPVLNPEELYGSKLVAAMDRQHPRDLFDVIGLFEEGGLTAGVVECFVCYLAGHNRPVHEVLFANQIGLESDFANEFQGMTQEPVSLDELLEVRHRLFRDLPATLTDAQRAFLLGLVNGKPDWSLMNCSHLQDLPAIRWKLKNLSRLRQSNPGMFTLQAQLLAERI